MAHVLIGLAEALPAPEVVFSLLRAGHEVSAFARSRKLPLAHLPLRALHVIPAPEEDARAAAAGVLRIMAGRDPPDVVLPLDDAGLWLVNEALGGDPRIAGATGRQAAIALDKEQQIARARAVGLDVPETMILHGGDVPAFDEERPLIAKPARAVSVLDGRLVKGAGLYVLKHADLAGLDGAFARTGGPLLLQPLVHGRGEGLFGFAAGGRVHAWSAHERMRMMNPHGSGSSACRLIRPDPLLCARVEKFLVAIGWHGAFMVEFLRDEAGRPWFMELNGRMWGSMALARRAGLEYPAWNVAACTDAGFVPEHAAVTDFGRVERHLGRDILHLLFTLRGPKSAFHRAGWPRFGKSLIQVLRPGRARNFYNYDPDFPFYFLRDALWTIRKTLRR